MQLGKTGDTVSHICQAYPDRVEVRGRDLCGDLMGRLSFTEYFHLLLTGEEPTEDQRYFLDLLLIAIAEHGMMPTNVAARMTLDADPGSLQGAVAAGILGCGPVILGTSESCALLLEEAQARVLTGDAPAEVAGDMARAIHASGGKAPGFGHPVHRPQRLLFTAGQRLLSAWREMIEKINRYETSSLTATGKQLWRSQDFEGRPPQDPPSDVASEFDGPPDASTFQRRFAELRKRFQEKYSRDITLTGADHAEHRRLYGLGSAYDIRVRDLTREQVAFIISTGAKLGMRIKDFSTWENVAAHNARTLMLGRPLDTLATGIHLHIDRVALTKKSLVSVPATAKRPRQQRLSDNK
jgi:hypothetical protein